MASEHLSINGATELRKKLYALGKKGSRACLRKSTRKGANIVLKAARASAPVGPTGNYRRGIKLKPKQSEGIISTWVRATARHSSLIEFGTKQRHTKSAPGYVGLIGSEPSFRWDTGKMPAMHTMKNAVGDVGQQALNVTVADLAERIVESAMGDGTGGGN